MLNKGKRQCLFGGHMAAKPTWPPIYVNLVAIWQDAGPDPIKGHGKYCFRIAYLFDNFLMFCDES